MDAWWPSGSRIESGQNAQLEPHDVSKPSHHLRATLNNIISCYISVHALYMYMVQSVVPYLVILAGDTNTSIAFECKIYTVSMAIFNI